MNPGVVAIFVPIISIIMGLSIPIFAFYYDYKKEQAKRQERIKAIEKGVEIPPEPVKPPLTAIDYLRRGLLSLAIGAGLGIGGFMMQSADKDAGVFFFTVGIIVFFVGIALVVFYPIKKKSE